MSSLIAYENWAPKPEAQAVIQDAASIIGEYQAQNFDLTLRQLYYQFVARDLIPNTAASYKRFGSIINRARLAGYLDWEAIVDRTREVEENSHWDSPADIIAACARQFRYDMWAEQPCHVEVWIEKEALIGVIERVCEEWDVPYFACRGYNSQSAQWRSGQRFKDCLENNQSVVVLHLGDHDPSGINMTDDNQLRLSKFAESNDVEVKRIALNIEQVRQYDPPANFAKESDSRYKQYQARFGDDCWELDALEPQVIVDLINDHILALYDEEQWAIDKERQVVARHRIGVVARKMRLEDEEEDDG